MKDMEKALEFNKDPKRETKLYYILSLAYRDMGKPFRACMKLD